MNNDQLQQLAEEKYQSCGEIDVHDLREAYISGHTDAMKETEQLKAVYNLAMDRLRACFIWERWAGKHGGFELMQHQQQQWEKYCELWKLPPPPKQ